jgi:hypothetical protein
MQPVRGFTTRLGAVVAVVLAIVAGAALAGCETNPENDTEVEEGRLIRVDDLLYNVQITRILNPKDPEDKAYLAGQERPGSDEYYLGVFLTVENDSDSPVNVPADFTVEDTVGTTYEPIPSESLFALKTESTLQPGDQLPELESTAANGPIQGAMVLFRITDAAIEDRPLTLHIPSSDGEVREVELDI